MIFITKKIVTDNIQPGKPCHSVSPVFAKLLKATLVIVEISKRLKRHTSINTSIHFLTKENCFLWLFILNKNAAIPNRYRLKGR